MALPGPATAQVKRRDLTLPILSSRDLVSYLTFPVAAASPPHRPLERHLAFSQTPMEKPPSSTPSPLGHYRRTWPPPRLLQMSLASLPVLIGELGLLPGSYGAACPSLPPAGQYMTARSLHRPLEGEPLQGPPPRLP